jgi:hypothetical protein
MLSAKTFVVKEKSFSAKESWLKDRQLLLAAKR